MLITYYDDFMQQSFRLWSIRIKGKLEQNNVHQCGMQVNKPICEYLGKVASGLVGGEAKHGKGKVTIEAGIEHMFDYKLHSLYYFNILYVKIKHIFDIDVTYYMLNLNIFLTLM